MSTAIENKHSKGEILSEAVFRNYLRQVEKVYQAGNATEHSYRSSLQELMKMLDAGLVSIG
jgi:hypothetical protein